MRITSLLVGAALLCVPVAASAETPLQKETAVWQAFKEKNAKAFQAMFAANYVGLYEDGTYNVDRELQSMKNTNLQSFKIGAFSSRMIDPDDMLMTYSVDVKGAHGKDDQRFVALAPFQQQVARRLPQRDQGQVAGAQSR